MADRGDRAQHRRPGGPDRDLQLALAEALRDTVYSVAATARGRAAKRTYLEPREAATEIVAHAETGPDAMVFGREDKGLTDARSTSARDGVPPAEDNEPGANDAVVSIPGS